MWQEIPVGGGVVRTRKQNSLDIGEWRQMTNCRYKRGDLRQIHNDWGRTDISPTLNSGETIKGVFVLSNESANDKLAVVTTNSGTMRILTTDIDTISWSEDFSGLASPTNAVAIHRGNQYFIGTGSADKVYDEGTVRKLGGPTGTSISSFTITASTGTSVIEEHDVYEYVITAYDSTNDIETPILYSNFIQVTSGQAGKAINLDIDALTPPSGYDKWRIYRHFYGTDAAAGKEAYWAANKAGYDKIRFGGLVAEVATGSDYLDDDTTNQTLASKYDPATKFPVISTDNVFGGSLFAYLEVPEVFDAGTIFNDCLVVNAPSTSKQILRYSPPGEPEYQPDPYFMYFATEQSDEIVGMHVINSRLVVLLKGGTWRVNYLPFEGNVAANQGRVQEPISRKVGCVGREAHTTVETEQGEFVCWVSQRGLEMSNGLGWTDACPDWSSAEVSGTLSQVVLENNPVASRLELYDGTTRWDFYYDPTLLKNGRFRLTGPHTHPVSVRFADANQTNMFTASTTKVYKEQVNQNSTDTILETGYIQGQSRFSDMTCDGVAMTHDAMANTTATARVYGKLQGEVEGGGTPSAIPTAFMALDETSDVRVAEMGTYLRLHMTLSGSDDWSVGPLEMDLKVTEGGNG